MIENESGDCMGKSATKERRGAYDVSQRNVGCCQQLPLIAPFRGEALGHRRTLPANRSNLKTWGRVRVSPTAHAERQSLLRCRPPKK